MNRIAQLSGVSFRYPKGDMALAELDLSLQTGEFVLVAGASGSGKSTLCRLFNGLIPHLHSGELGGKVLVAGHDVRTRPPHMLSREVGFVSQNPDAQCVGSTVARDLAFGLACHGLPRAEIVRRVQEVADLLELNHLLQRSPHTLSGGEQQRVALAGAVALRPTLLVLDEPFVFLDAAGASRLRSTLQMLHRRGVTIVVAEHRLQEVAALATRMLVLQAGRVVADGPPREVLSGDLRAWGLEPPPLVRLAQQAGLRNVPLTTDEAAQMLGGRPMAWPTLPQPTAELRPVVEWDGVRFERNGHAILRSVDFTAAAGTTTALLGGNGAGKTTLLHHANGLLRPTQGEVRVLGRPVGRRPVGELAREVGLVVQQPLRMFFAPTVREEIRAGPRALGRYDAVWCEELAERWGLTRVLERAPQQLSAGQQRRVAIAAILAVRPGALLLDEPTAGLDAAGRQTLLDAIVECAGEGTTILQTTHDTEWALVSSPDWAVLLDGRIVANERAETLAAQPALFERARLRLPEIAALRLVGQGKEGAYVRG